MTIDEAIEHAIQIADSYKDTAPDCDCARDHRQLAEWLKKARVYEKAKKRSVSMIRKLKEENDKLRWKLEVLKAHGIEIVDAVAGGYEIYSDDHKEAERLTTENARLSTQLTDVTESMGRVEERCAKLREELEDQEGYDQMLRDRLRQQTELCVKAEAENAKLLKIVSCLLTCANDTGDCDRCPLNGGTGDWNSEDFCDDLLDCLRELGIEVQQ